MVDLESPRLCSLVSQLGKPVPALLWPSRGAAAGLKGASNRGGMFCIPPLSPLITHCISTCQSLMELCYLHTEAC